jgi:hypothetical protein
MNVVFHAITSFGIGHVAARNLDPAVPGWFDRRDLRVLTVVFIAGVLSHGVLDGLKHGYPVSPFIDPPLALLLAAVWVRRVQPRYSILIVTAFAAAILPDVIDLGLGVARYIFGMHRPNPPSSHVFPWHWRDGSGSLYSLAGAPEHPGHGDLDRGDNRAVSATNHVIVVFLSCAAVLSNRTPFRRNEAAQAHAA